MSIIVQEMGLSNTHYGMESADTIEMDFLTDTAELDSLSNDLDTAHDAMASMESLAQVEGVPGPVLLVAAENMLAHMGYHESLNLPSMESEADATYGMERLGDIIKKIWEAISNAFKKVWGAISGFFKKLFGVKEKVAKKAKENVETIEKVLKEDPKATVKVSKEEKEVIVKKISIVDSIKKRKPIAATYKDHKVTQSIVEKIEKSIEVVDKLKTVRDVLESVAHKDADDLVKALDDDIKAAHEEFNAETPKNAKDVDKEDTGTEAEVTVSELHAYSVAIYEAARDALKHENGEVYLNRLKGLHDKIGKLITTISEEDKPKEKLYRDLAKHVSKTMQVIRTRAAIDVNTSRKQVSHLNRTIRKNKKVLNRLGRQL